MIQFAMLSFSSLALAAAGIFVLNFYQNVVAYFRLKKLTKGLPMLDELMPFFGNHILFILKPKLPLKLAEIHAHSEHKTLTFMIGKQFAASTIDLDLMKTIIYDESNLHVNRTTLNLPLEEHEKSIMIAKDDDWRKLRRYFAPALKAVKFKTPNVMSEVKASIRKLTDLIDQKLEERALQTQECARVAREGREFNLDDLVHKFSLNVVFSCLYKQYNLIDFANENEPWTKRVDEGLEALQTNVFVKLSMIFPQLRRLIDWFIWHFHPQGAWRRKIMHFVKLQTRLGLEARKRAREMEAEAKRKGEQVDLNNFMLEDGTKFRRNMIDTVIDHFLDGKLTKDEFFNTSCFLLSAADKTASDCLVHTLYQIASHPDIQDKLRVAVRADGTEADYLSWVLNESLRLLPPAPIGCARTVTRDFKLDGGYVLPATTFVVCSAFAVHRLEEYWGKDASEFKPERWQDTSHHHPMQFIPFGAGPRGCPGKEFALFEMKLLLVALLTRYRFECKPKDDIYSFDSPLLIFSIPNSITIVTIQRLIED